MLIIFQEFVLCFMTNYIFMPEVLAPYSRRIFVVIAVDVPIVR